MSVDISEIRAGLEANLSSITGCQTSAYRIAAPSPPTIMVVGFDQITATSFGRSGFEIPMLVQGLAGLPTEKSAQIRLDRWLSPTDATTADNVWAALESDRTLGGKVSTLAVTSCDGSQILTLDNGTDVLGTTWHVLIEL